jgi:hypothetical protein
MDAWTQYPLCYNLAIDLQCFASSSYFPSCKTPLKNVAIVVVPFGRPDKYRMVFHSLHIKIGHLHLRKINDAPTKTILSQIVADICR